MSSSYGTRQGAEAFIRAALGQWAPEHDVPAIADALHEHAGQCWDMGRVDTDLFWQVVEAHAIDEGGGDAGE